MLIHRLSREARRLLPGRVFSALRTCGNAVLTPLFFSYYTGHARSALAGKAVDRHGAPLPWYTYPAIHFFAAQDFQDKDVLEFGAGQSTLYWAGRARSVTALEADAGWHDYLHKRLPGNVSLHLVADFPALERILAGRRFDLVIIDGLDVPGLGRLGCARRSLSWLAEGGAIVLDNSDGSWNPDGRFLIMDHFREHGLQRVDFYGWDPGNVAPSCTSLFFRQGPCFLLSGRENPRMPYPLAQHE